MIFPQIFPRSCYRAIKYSPVVTTGFLHFMPRSLCKYKGIWLYPCINYRAIRYCPVVATGHFLLQGYMTVQRAHCAMEGEERKGEYEGSSISMHSWQPACPRVPGRRCAQASHLGSKQPISLEPGHAICGCHLLTIPVRPNLSLFAKAPKTRPL